MTLQELKKEAGALSPEEQTQLRGFLRTLELARDPEWLEEIDKRGREMRAGKYVTEEELTKRITEHDAAAS